jgi:methionine aminotransferase
MMNEVKSKLPNVGTTIFTVMSKMATDHGAINLSQGFPDFPIDPVLEELLASKAKQQVHQYMPMAGHPELLSEIGKMVERRYGRCIDTSKELLVTAGATQGIFATIQALVHSGEEVLILDPCYDCYESPVILSGAVPVHIPLNDDFTPDWDLIDQRISPKTRLLILNNPHNPSGKVLNEGDIDQLEALMQRHPHLLLLSDEVYEFITFEKPHISINTRLGIRNRSIIISSFGKTFHITGWKVGYLIASEQLLNEIKRVHQFLVFCVNSLAQATLASYLKVADVDSLGAFYQQKRDVFRELLRTSRFKLMPSEGSYFQVASFDAISDETDVEFCERLVKVHGVAAIPLSVFNKNLADRKLIRFCFAKEGHTLIQAAEKLCKI